MMRIIIHVQSDVVTIWSSVTFAITSRNVEAHTIKLLQLPQTANVWRKIQRVIICVLVDENANVLLILFLKVLRMLKPND